MPVYKNKNGNGWYAMVRYTDWQGNKKQKCQRGFATRREAQDFEAQFILKKKAGLADLSENDPCAALGDLQSRNPLL